MSKATEWENLSQAADNARLGLRFNDGALIHDRLFVTVERGPNLSLRIKPANNQLDSGITINLVPEKALILARWITETFGGVVEPGSGAAPPSVTTPGGAE